MKRVALGCALLFAACPVGTAPIDFSGKTCGGNADCAAGYSCVDGLCELPDAGIDAGIDAGVDAGVDAGLDAGPDAGGDAGLDAGFDAGLDAGFDAGLDAGFDAGPQCASAPLAGTVTLNGGEQVPAANLAWVDVWDHPPQLLGPDGGRPYEPPTIQTQVNQVTGAFSIAGVTIGKQYWISGQYDIAGNLDAGDLVDDALSPPASIVPGLAPACSLSVDVSTIRRCEVVSSYSATVSSGAYVLDVVADIPNISTNLELDAGAIVQAQVPDSGSAEILSLSLEPDPTVVDAGLDFGGADNSTGPLVYARAGGLHFALFTFGQIFNAYSGPYGFSVVGTGYKSGSCEVPVTPQSTQPVLDPSITSGTRQWDAGYEVTWQSAHDTTSAPGQVTYSDLVLLGTTDQNVYTTTWASQQMPQNPSSHSINVPPDACPTGSRCVLAVFSARDVLSSIGANPELESLEESVAIAELPTAP